MSDQPVTDASGTTALPNAVDLHAILNDANVFEVLDHLD